jgi:hypothetical protein
VGSGGWQADCGRRFRLEKHPEQSKPVSVGSSGGGGRARRDKIFGSQASLEREVAWRPCESGVAHMNNGSVNGGGVIRAIGKELLREKLFHLRAA